MSLLEHRTRCLSVTQSEPMSVLLDPPELGHEAMVMHAGWSENVAQHRAWLQHLASAAIAGRLLSGEVELLGQLVRPTSVEQWLAEFRNLAARVPANGASATGQVRERLELLAEVAYAVRRATVTRSTPTYASDV